MPLFYRHVHLVTKVKLFSMSSSVTVFIWSGHSSVKGLMAVSLVLTVLNCDQLGNETWIQNDRLVLDTFHVWLFLWYPEDVHLWWFWWFGSRCCRWKSLCELDRCASQAHRSVPSLLISSLSALRPQKNVPIIPPPSWRPDRETAARSTEDTEVWIRRAFTHGEL